MSEQACAFVVHASDNVATLLCDVVAEERVVLRGAGNMRDIVATEAMTLGHKLALVNMDADAPVVKFGVPIGRTTAPVVAGQWVHLHNCASDLDERSSTFDVNTGETTDTRYE